jgi:hypothetical protein
MPLIESGSKEAVGKNIQIEETAGKKPHNQAVAIALETQRRFGGGHVGIRPVHKKIGIKMPHHQVTQAPGK